MDNKNEKTKRVLKYSSQEMFYIIMSVVIGLLIILLLYIGISHIVYAVKWTDVESVSKSFYVVVSVFAFIIIGLFSFAEYLMIKLLLNIFKKKEL